MKGHGEKISRKQEQAIINLLQEPTIHAAAEKTGIGEATLWRWLQLPDFQEQYREARRQIVNKAVTRLQQASSQAVDCLEEIMKDTDAPASSRVSAAKVVLEMAVKAVESENVIARLEVLETMLGEVAEK